ncbi:MULTISPECIES: 6-phosphogluconolactonase [Micrococcaceae]|uniref:6-phosphogluconolactonase n=1 Tax=Micrococcaceae TaxID=1268 RepID=UPI001036ACCF|nr:MULTISPECIES: 6-phosphogluconolactonase [Micrococcaceae]TAP27510.1 6-phosphogluconolactonase [Arthrobacter sp. S41]UXN30823.1 6-phosphogluconolactonase [Glutamicibacter sp. M10]
MIARQITIHDDVSATAQAIAARLITSITDAVTARGVAHIVVTGGTLGIAALAAVAQNPAKASVNWSQVHFWWGDERFVAADSPDRNVLQAEELFAALDQLGLDRATVHAMGSTDEFETAEEAAVAYTALLAAEASEGAASPVFDVLMLGMGPDSHVASLFPNHTRSEELGAIAVHNSPKPPPHRVSLTMGTINTAREVWLIVAGADKAPALAAASHEINEVAVPASAVHGTEATRWIVDRAASTLL